MHEPILNFILNDASKTEELGRAISTLSSAGDTFLLEGDIGAGKTTFARAFVKYQCGAETEVPSPTFTIVQSYEGGAAEIWHCDLYRLDSSQEAEELGLEAAFDNCICLVEWPDRLGSMSPPNAFTLKFDVVHDRRSVTLFGPKEWVEKISSLFDGS